MPLPNSRIIPPGWSAHHRGPLESAWTGVCEVTRTGGTGTTDEHGEWTPGSSTLVYSGPCRLVHVVGDEQEAFQGGDKLSFRRYLVQIRADTEVRVGDFVQVLSAPSTAVVGRQFRVESYNLGTEGWSTDLLVTEFQEGT